MRCTGASRIVQVHPTRLCNLRCLHCYSASGPEVRGELEVGFLCDALAGASALGYTAMTLSGGEPQASKRATTGVSSGKLESLPC